MKRSKQLRNYMINDVMEYFNFKRVHEIMIATEWEWLDSFEGEDKYHVPDEQKIRKLAKKLLKRAWKERAIISTGGFTAIYSETPDVIHLNLFFGESSFSFMPAECFDENDY